MKPNKFSIILIAALLFTPACGLFTPGGAAPAATAPAGAPATEAPAAQPPAAGGDCLTGSWVLDNDSYLAHLNALMEQAAPGTIQYTTVEGTSRLQFSGSTVSQQLDHMTVNAEMHINDSPVQNMVIVIDGTTTASFSAAGGSLQYSNTQSALTVTTTINGQVISSADPSGAFASGPIGPGAGYTCEGGALTMSPVYSNYSNLPPLVFNRQP